MSSFPEGMVQRLQGTIDKEYSLTVTKNNSNLELDKDYYMRLQNVLDYRLYVKQRMIRIFSDHTMEYT